MSELMRRVTRSQAFTRLPVVGTVNDGIPVRRELYQAARLAEERRARERAERAAVRARERAERLAAAERVRNALLARVEAMRRRNLLRRFGVVSMTGLRRNVVARKHKAAQWQSVYDRLRGIGHNHIEAIRGADSFYGPRLSRGPDYDYVMAHGHRPPRSR